MLPGPAFFVFMRFFLLLGSLDCSLSSLDLWVSSLDLWVSSLDYWEVRWFYGEFVGILGSSLEYSRVRWIIVFRAFPGNWTDGIM